MKEKELVIKIPEKWFDDMVREEFTEVDELCAVIQHGTLLPKGHGRLIDADRLKTHFVGTEQGTDLEVYLETTIIDAPTIIEADKETE